MGQKFERILEAQKTQSLYFNQSISFLWGEIRKFFIHDLQLLLSWFYAHDHLAKMVSKFCFWEWTLYVIHKFDKYTITILLILSKFYATGRACKGYHHILICR